MSYEVPNKVNVLLTPWGHNSNSCSNSSESDELGDAEKSQNILLAAAIHVNFHPSQPRMPAFKQRVVIAAWR
jgi:hypothetical protein